MKESGEQIDSVNRTWWGLWMAATVVLPAVLGALGSMYSDIAGMLVLVLGFAGLQLHEEACKRLAPPRSWLHFFLMFGGGALMVSSAFSGCLVFRAHS